MRYQKFDELIVLKLDSLNIKETLKYKYLRHEISDCIHGSEHIRLRRIKASRSIYKLKSLCFYSNELTLNTKSLM